MITIRRGVFETNSSSTHSLSFPKDCTISYNGSTKLIEFCGIITPLSHYDYDGNCLIIPKDDLKGKLRYLYTAYIQRGRQRTTLFKLIQDTVPNAIFQDTFQEYPYIIEDIEYLFDGKNSLKEWCEDLDGEKLKKFLLYGEVHVWNRDDEEAQSQNDFYQVNDATTISWTG